MTSVTQDYANLANNLEALQLQLWIMSGVLGSVFLLLGFFFREAWTDIKSDIKKQGLDIGDMKVQFAEMKGSNSSAKAIGDELLDGFDKLTDAITDNHKKRKQ